MLDVMGKIAPICGLAAALLLLGKLLVALFTFYAVI